MFGYWTNLLISTRCGHSHLLISCSALPHTEVSVMSVSPCICCPFLVFLVSERSHPYVHSVLSFREVARWSLNTPRGEKYFLISHNH